jgi:RNA polymerase sigma-32 factor
MSPKKIPVRKKTAAKTKAKPKPTGGARALARPSAALSPEVLPAEGAKKPAARGKTRLPAIEDEGEIETLAESNEEAEESDLEGDPEPGEGAYAGDGTAIATRDPSEIDREIVSAGRAISPTDPLRRYLDEVRRHPLLTPEEEIALATKLHASGDIEAAKRLVQANLRLVVKIAFEYKSVYANVMDLIQEGNIGLMKAVSKYDPTKGARLGYYSSWWIRSYILKYLLDNFRLVRVGTTAAQKKLFFHLMREKERLEAQGILAGPKLLADKLQVREKDVVEMEKRLGSAGGEVSLDSPVSQHGEGRGTYVDLLEDREEGVDDRLAQEELIALVKKRMPEFEKTLNERERRLLRDRLLAEEPKTLQEVADHYGLTRERARQIEAGVVAKLREFLKDGLR